jgi:hypothetical protein
MNRAVQAPVKMSQVVAAALRWLAPGLYGIETPRRSVDREVEATSATMPHGIGLKLQRRCLV